MYSFITKCKNITKLVKSQLLVFLIRSCKITFIRVNFQATILKNYQQSCKITNRLMFKQYVKFNEK